MYGPSLLMPAAKLRRTGFQAAHAGEAAAMLPRPELASSGPSGRGWQLAAARAASCLNALAFPAPVRQRRLERGTRAARSALRYGRGASPMRRRLASAAT